LFLNHPIIPFLGELLGSGGCATERLCNDAADVADASDDDREDRDDADDAREAGIETTGGKILIPPGATTLPLRDDADDALSLSIKRSPRAPASPRTGSF
jgi:hypothetical protein